MDARLDSNVAVAEQESGPRLNDFEILGADRIAAFLSDRKGASIVIGSGDTRFRPAAELLAAWLKQTYQIDSRITTEGPRAVASHAYMLGFGGRGSEDPVRADILIGNCQDNGLMWRFVRRDGGLQLGWLPLEVNQNFPGSERAVVMLSSTVITNPDGSQYTPISGAEPITAEPQLIIGASFPTEALSAVRALQQRLK